jgi:aminoglycoside 3-N-acetyltransferase
MKEQEIIQRTGDSPITVSSLADNLSALGLSAGMTVLVHSSLSALGWVCGGAVSVVQALQHVLGRTGTLVMPTHTGDLSDPAHWQHPPVPESWWAIIRQTMPGYHSCITPTRGMGAIPENFRTQPGVLRSDHPQYSFAAWGQHAAKIIKDHQLEFGLGESSPLAKIYQLDGWVLLLGVGHDSNTSLHLSEYRANYRSKITTKNGTSILTDGRQQWVTFADINLDSDDFADIGRDFAQTSGRVREGSVGLASAQLMPQQALVDFGTAWMTQHRR